MKVRTDSIVLGKDEGCYIKLLIDSPTTPSKYLIKLAFFDIKFNRLKEGMEIELMAVPEDQLK